MSLKIFHIFFVVVCIGFSVFFGTWCLQSGNTAYYPLAGGSFTATVGLLIYLAWVVRKLKGFSFFAWVAAVGFFAASDAHACAVCLGNPDSMLVKAANEGVWFMLIVVAGMLAAFLSLFLFWAYRAHQLSKPTA